MKASDKSTLQERVTRFYWWMRCLVFVCFGGCATIAPSYIQGVNVGAGIKIPCIEGCQLTIFDYVSGIKIITVTNMPFKVTYKESVTNDYFQIIRIREDRETEIDFTAEGAR